MPLVGNVFNGGGDISDRALRAATGKVVVEPTVYERAPIHSKGPFFSVEEQSAAFPSQYGPLSQVIL